MNPARQKGSQKYILLLCSLYAPQLEGDLHSYFWVIRYIKERRRVFPIHLSLALGPVFSKWRNNQHCFRHVNKSDIFSTTRKWLIKPKHDFISPFLRICCNILSPDDLFLREMLLVYKFTCSFYDSRPTLTVIRSLLTEGRRKTAKPGNIPFKLRIRHHI